jgi:hypothetical protein
MNVFQIAAFSFSPRSGRLVAFGIPSRADSLKNIDHVKLKDSD